MSDQDPQSGGALEAIRVVELGGIGPGPHASMLLADLGADVVRLERPAGGLQVVDHERDVTLRSRRSIVADLRDRAIVDSVRELLLEADVLIDGFRPGVTDRFGIGPAVLTEQNPRLIYARVTGWGADGPWSSYAGHDINYLAITGVLHAIGTDGARPPPPLNLIGDFGGGSLYLALGIVSALVERARSGRGQVVEAAIVDGVTSLAQSVWSLHAQGEWAAERASNLLDGGAPFYDTYACADGRFVAVGALEPQFYRHLLAGLGLEPDELPAQWDRSAWPELRARFASVFAGRTRDEWSATFEGTDACVTPVLTFGEAAGHPQLAARGSLVTVGGILQAGPAPRFSRSVAQPPRVPPVPGSATLADVLRSWRRPPSSRTTRADRG